jgi:hypothetical protein
MHTDNHGSLLLKIVVDMMLARCPAAGQQLVNCELLIWSHKSDDFHCSTARLCFASLEKL